MMQRMNVGFGPMIGEDAPVTVKAGEAPNPRRKPGSSGTKKLSKLGN